MTIFDFINSWNNDDCCLQVHTSGSTGKPKNMLVEKTRMMNSARITCNFLNLKAGDTALLCMSADYIAGKMMIVRSIERGLCLVSEKPCGHPLSDEALATASRLNFKRTSADSLKTTIREEGAYHLDNDDAQLDNDDAQLDNDDAQPLFCFAAMVPMQVYNSLQIPKERARLARIKHLIIGGGAIDDALAAELKTLPNAVWSTYGMTETLSHIALRRLNGPDASLWYTPFDSVQVQLTDEGCLVIDAPQVTPHPIITNDIAEIVTTPHTRFRIKGRKDNVICSGGIKIQIEEVEELLRPHLSRPFFLTKKKDEKFGEIAVMLTEDEQVNKVENICKQVLPRYFAPKEYIYVNKLPMTETGKPRRKI